MSGHSKFANIKHKKEKNDAKKGKIFTVIGRELVMAVKAGGPDPNNNSFLVVVCGISTCCFFDTTFDCIVWHVVCFRFGNYITKFAVVIRIRTAFFDRQQEPYSR